jgi:predicted transposase YbfD/YdcC
MPHHTTYGRILDICAEEIEQAVSLFMVQLPSIQDSQIISMDGKTVRGTITQEDSFGLHLLSIYLPTAGVTLKQLPVDKEKENEIVVAPKALENLDLEGKIVVGDAMQTQRALSTQIVKRGGDYIWIAKGNQAKTQAAIEQLFAPQTTKPGFGIPPTDFVSAQTVEKQHGRLEERTLTTSSMLNEYLDWPAVQQVFKLERRFAYSVSGAVHHEIQYGLTSLNSQEATPQKLLEVVRAEWGIENELHYRRDVTFHEDATRMTRKSVARAMACLNNLVIALFYKHGFSNHAHARRVFAAKPLEALSLILRL